VAQPANPALRLAGRALRVEAPQPRVVREVPGGPDVAEHVDHRATVVQRGQEALREPDGVKDEGYVPFVHRGERAMVGDLVGEPRQRVWLLGLRFLDVERELAANVLLPRHGIARRGEHLRDVTAGAEVVDDPLADELVPAQDPRRIEVR
jgi:hypothetical protein